MQKIQKVRGIVIGKWLTEQSLLTLDDPGLNPNIGNNVIVNLLLFSKQMNFKEKNVLIKKHHHPLAK